MKKLTLTLCLALALTSTLACGDSDGDAGNNGAANNGPANNGNNGPANNGNNGNNGPANNGNNGNNGGPALLGKANPPALGAQIDRTGRPAISTALISTFSADADAKGAEKDAYNAASPDKWGDYAGSMAASLAILDAIDGTCGNQLLADADAGADRYMTLASILSDDELYVHSERGECGTYLGLEAEIVGAVPEGAGGCGGRTLNDDIIDRSYSVLAAGILTGVDDTITGDDVAHLDGFPYVGEPSAN